MIELPHKRFHMLLHGHVLDRLRELPDGSVDCIMTSPPYFGLRFYRGAESIWGGDPNCDHDFSNAQPADLLHENRNNRRGTQEEVTANPTGTTYIRKEGSSIESATCSKCGSWKGQLGLEADINLYLSHLLMVTAELKRVLKSSGTLWWNMGSGYDDKADLLIPERFAIQMVDRQGWILRNVIIWKKGNHMPESAKDRLTRSYEFVYFFVKKPKYFFDLDAIRVPLSPVALKEIEKEYNGTSLKDYGGAMAQDASESKRRIVKSLQKYRSGSAERKTEQLRLSHLGSSIPWPAEDSHGGKDPGDVLHYDSKYVKDEYGQPLQGSARDQSIVEGRRKSREEAVKLFPGDVEKQQEYINFVHDHDGHPSGKNPGDTMDYAEWYFNEREKKSWHDHRDDMEKGMHHTGHMESVPHPFGKHPDDFWEINPRPHKFNHLLADYVARDGTSYKVSPDCPIHAHLLSSRKNDRGQYDEHSGHEENDISDSDTHHGVERLSGPISSPSHDSSDVPPSSQDCHPQDMLSVDKRSGIQQNRISESSYPASGPSSAETSSRTNHIQARNESSDHKTDCLPHADSRIANDRSRRNYRKSFQTEQHDTVSEETSSDTQCIQPQPAVGGHRPGTSTNSTFGNVAGDPSFQTQNRTVYRQGSWGGRCTCKVINTDHFAVYPVELCIMPIKAGCPKDGVVLDPFAGSGTTGVAARQLGRSSILIEISDEYCKIAKQRMEWGQQALDGTEWIEK